jgi:formylglycine-generating enzyme required for sulfatase activity
MMAFSQISLLSWHSSRFLVHSFLHSKHFSILMNGGVCGRRAFIGRFILRSFGIPTEARPSSGHGALCHWTLDKGWVVNLGGEWGCGWTRTVYGKDVGFLATTQARLDTQAYWKVKRGQWIGDVMGEQRVYSEQQDGPVGFWYGLSLHIQKAIIDDSKNKKLAKPPQEPVKVKPTMRERVLAAPASPDAQKIVRNSDDGTIVVPAAGFINPKQTKDVYVMTSFLGGLQIYLPSFSPEGKTMMRGGTWKNDGNVCCSGHRLLSDGFGKYNNWGFRACVSPPTNEGMDVDIKNSNDAGTCNIGEVIKLDLGSSGVTMELIYIKPGTFIMGGENAEDGRFKCVDVPKHKVELTRGFYLGKYPVTQAQYEAIMGKNPSKSTKAPDCPVDNISEDEAVQFCTKLGDISGLDVRLPSDAEWEYASRAGRDTKWFFGDDPSQLGDYAWFSGNAGGKSQPVGQKRPNQWGLYDIYGNVCERVADKYASNYYATSPTIDPTGPNQGTKSRFEYSLNIPRSGKYSVVASVVTVNYNQRLNVSVKNRKGDSEEAVVEMPFTLGQWQESAPVMLSLEEGDNILRFWRDKPPQFGLVIKHFILKPC